MTRGQLPKAYLRIDPNIDQTHPDNLDGFIRLLCAANRQPRRGSFRNRTVLVALLGKAATNRLYARGDVVDTPDSVQVPGWETWQEGDLDVGERMRRYRARLALQGGTPAVTAGVTAGVTQLLPTSEASRRLGVKALDVLSDATSRAHEVGDQPELEAVAWLARHGCALSETNGLRRKLITLVERFGVNAVVGKFDRLSAAGLMDGDARGFVFGAEEQLFPKADLRTFEREELAVAERERFNRDVARTQRLIRETQTQAPAHE